MDTIWTLIHTRPDSDEPDRAVFASHGEALEYLIVNFGEPDSNSSLTIAEEMQEDGHLIYLDEWRLNDRGHWERAAFVDGLSG